MNARLVIITGANSGLGFETARRIASMSQDTTVVLACRDLGKAEVARGSITASTGHQHVRAMHLDLSSLASVREFAAQHFDQTIDALVCNAGISRGAGPTVDGFDPVFQTNHLGHFLLALSLTDAMAPAGRVISVSSDMHEPPGPTLRWPGAEALASPDAGLVVHRQRYSLSKLCNLYFTYEFARRLRAYGSGISATAFNPGLMTDTNFASMPRVAGTVLRRVFASRVGSLDGSSTALAELVLAKGDQPQDGLYFDRSATHPTRSSNLSYDIVNAKELWELSERLTAA